MEDLNTSGSSRTEHEKPLSPVLNHKFNRKLVIDRKLQNKKAKAKLTDRFSNTARNVTTNTQDGKSLVVSEDSFTASQTENLLHDIEKLEQLQAGGSQVPIQTNDSLLKQPLSLTTSGGFQTASGKSIALSQQKVEEHCKLFNDILSTSDLDCSRSNKYSFLSKAKPKGANSAVKNDVNSNYAMFKSASGKYISVSSKGLERAGSVFDGIISQTRDHERNSGALNTFGLDSTTISKTSVNVPLKIFSKTHNFNEPGGLHVVEGIPFHGFKPSEVIEAQKALEAFQQILELCNKPKLKSFKNVNAKRPILGEIKDFPPPKKLKPEDSICRIPSSFGGFKSASGNAIKISETSLKKANQAFEEFGINNDSINIETPSKNPNSSSSALPSGSKNNQNSGFQTASGTDVKVSREGLRNAAKFLESVDSLKPEEETKKIDSSWKSAPRSKKRLGVSSFRPIQISRDKLARAKLLFDDDESPVKPNQSRQNATPVRPTPVSSSTPLKINTSAPFNSTITPIKFDETVKTVLDSSLVIQNCTEGNVDFWNKELEDERKKLETRLRVLAERQQALNVQKGQLGSLDQAHRKKRDGVLTLQKLTVDRIRLQNLSIKCGVDSSITPQNAVFVHFRCRDAIVKTLDGAVVVPNVKDLIGLSEIESAFKAMPGVEPKLIPKGWIRNHYKWIVWKLADYKKIISLEESLDVQNVVQQLKYRYDREIDKAERPALCRIFEKDDVPQKRMILRVSDVFKLSENKFEIELTDGWYSVRTAVDDGLSEQIFKGRIQLGTKMIICGAELLNCEGCHPLEASDLIRLKINCNSTRRAAWFSKLGFQSCLEPFPIKLSSVLPSGGVIGCVKIYVARVYPLRFLEKQGTLNVWRNKKAEERRAQEWDNEQMLKMERVQEVIRRDYENSVVKKKSCSINLNRGEISKITCPETLYDLCESSRDPEKLQEFMSQSQKDAVMDYRTNVLFARQQELSFKIKSGVDKLNLPQRDVSPVMKLLVVDALHDDDQGYTFLIWRPTDSHLEMLKEGSIFNAYNVQPKKNGVLNSLNRTKFKPVTEISPKYSKYDRSLLLISNIRDSVSKPFVNEFDTVGIIVQLEVEASTQHLWLSDFSDSLLIIRVFDGPKNCCLFDNLKKGQVVAASNLIFNESKLEFAQAVANHFSVISSYPQNKHLQESVEELRQKLPKDINEFLRKTEEKISFYLDKVNVMKSTSYGSVPNSLLELNQAHASDVLEEGIDETITYAPIASPTDVQMSLVDIDKFT